MADVTISQRDYDALIWRAGVDLNTVQVGDELILRVTVAQIQPPRFGGRARVCFEDGGGMLAVVHPHSVISHFPMDAGPRNVSPSRAAIRQAEGGE